MSDKGPIILLRWHNMPWGGCNLRKPSRCHKCRRALLSGEAAYRPLSNSVERGLRLCAACGNNMVGVWA